MSKTGLGQQRKGEGEGGEKGLRSRNNEGDHKPKEHLTLAIIGGSCLLKILKIPALLAFHHGALATWQWAGGDPGCKREREVNPLPENAPRLWSDALRQWTKSVWSH
jgi:hypothetical protein